MSTVARIFDVQGPIASALPKYEQRAAQTEMARAVERVIEKNGVLIAEAATGTGKTMAYLVPAILSKCTVVISTGTKNLQEQVYFKDIRFLEKALKTTVSAVYLKGQDNYLCLRRLHDFLHSPRVLSYSPKRINEIQEWSRETEAGDRMELAELPDDDRLWREICSTRETRIGPRCPYAGDCFIARARQLAAQSRIIVVNHHLYFADLATRLRGGSILPSHDVVVFDEAHTIENIATEFFSTTVSSARVDRALRDVKSTLRSATFADDPAAQRRPKLIKAAAATSDSLFHLFKGPKGRIRLVPEDVSDDRLQAYHRLDSALEGIEHSLGSLEGRNEAVDHLKDRVRSLRNDLATVIGACAKGFVHWIENTSRVTVLGASPIDVSATLREGVFFSIPTVILTSATLSTGTKSETVSITDSPVCDCNFTFLKDRLGIDFDVDELSLSSVFDYQKQARLYLPDHLPDPRSGGFSQACADEIQKLVQLTKGGALLLFTSLQNMKTVYGILKERLLDEPLFLQGDAPKSRLIAQFVNTPGSVLCASASFWQGVDIPGDPLRLVVIDKLPFASPTDPLIAARIADLEAKGRKPFMEYQVPQAALSLKQGFGRLIRTQYDVGIVAILDSRLHKMPYAKTILRSLPPCPRIQQFDQLKQWWLAT